MKLMRKLEKQALARAAKEARKQQGNPRLWIPLYCSQRCSYISLKPHSISLVQPSWLQRRGGSKRSSWRFSNSRWVWEGNLRFSVSLRVMSHEIVSVHFKRKLMVLLRLQLGCHSTFLNAQQHFQLTDFLLLSYQEKIKRIQQIRMEKELRAQQILEVWSDCGKK